MNTRHADLAKFAPLPVTPDIALALPGDDQCAEVDAEWLEFLSLGACVDLSGSAVGSGWRHAPVLLSY